ncbi:trigger factor [Buchnera aphidicola]|uniref:trigger factor n=1 Tax=Buchnera aphidicola TaxID=9 RepID=UPI0034646A94
MEFSLKTIKNFDKKLTISIPLNDIHDVQKKEIIKIRKTAIINGFRKNKIPINIIQEKYKNEIKNTVIKKIISYNFKNIIKKKKLKIINEPIINIKKNKKNSNLMCSIYFQSLPNIDFKILKKITINKISIITHDEDASYYIENIRKNCIIWKNTKNKIQIKNKITIDCIFHIINEKEKNKKIQLTFIIGKKTIIPEIETELLNKKIGDTIYIKLKIPSDHPDINYQGKMVQLKIYVNNIQSDEIMYSKKECIDFLKKTFNINKDNELKEIILNKIQTEVMNLEYHLLKTQLIHQLLNTKMIEIPIEISEKEKKNMQNDAFKNYHHNKGNIFQSKYYKNFQKKAEKKLLLDFMIKILVQDNKISVTENELQKQVKKLKKNQPELIKKIKIQYQKNDFINYVKNMIIEKKIMNHLLKLFKIKEKKYHFKKAIQILNQK